MCVEKNDVVRADLHQGQVDLDAPNRAVECALSSSLLATYHLDVQREVLSCLVRRFGAEERDLYLTKGKRCCASAVLQFAEAMADAIAGPGMRKSGPEMPSASQSRPSPSQTLPSDRI